MGFDWRLLLSHHRKGDEGRCLKVRGLLVCSRCAGLYPAAALTLLTHAAGLRLSPLQDALVLYALPAPALIDWGATFIDGRPGTNTSRLLSGVLLGVSVGRLVFINATTPFVGKVVSWLCLTGGLALIALLIRAVYPARYGS